jgi:hypothetical protein
MVAAERQRWWQRGGGGGSTVGALAEWRMQRAGGGRAVAAAAAQQRHWQRGGGIGSMVAASAEAARRKRAARRQHWQHGVSNGSAVAASAEWQGQRGSGAVAAVVFRKEWYRKTGKEVMEGRPLLHRLLGFKSRCKGCLKLIIMMLF